MADLNADRRRFLEHLPFYLNGTLSHEDHEWVAAYLAAHPGARTEAAVAGKLRDITKSTISPVPELERLNKLLTELRQTTARRSFVQRLAEWFLSPFRIPAPAMAIVAALLVGQAATIAMLAPNTDRGDIFRGDADCKAGARIRIMFKPDAKQSDMVLLLRQVGGTLQGGPSATGEIWVTFLDDKSAQQAMVVLKASPAVDDAVPSMPAESANCPK